MEEEDDQRQCEWMLVLVVYRRWTWNDMEEEDDQRQCEWMLVLVVGR